MSVLQYGNLINQVASTVNSGGTTTLVNTSAQIQSFSGTLNQILQLPDATTFTKPGISYQIFNLSTGIVQVNYNDGSSFQTIPANSTLIVNCLTNSTSNGTWTTLTNSTVPSVNAPTMQIFTSGSGTYTAPTSPAPLYIRVIGVGGGAGGTGADNSGTPTTSGGNTTFGSSFLVANGAPIQVTGGGGSFRGGEGGSASIGVGATGIAIQGGSGTGGPGNTGAAGTAGAGGNSPFGGAGGGGADGIIGFSGATNSGSGGGGGGGTTQAGAGGGAGGYFNAIITAPSSTYPYVVGTGGTGQAAGGGEGPGGNGASGVIIVEEHYQ
jgi:hypothetical protein